MFAIEKQKHFAAILLFTVSLMFSAGLYAGDVASFVDLGFSENGAVYMFAQYGVDEHTLRPWSELYIVDVGKNDFVKGGRLSYRHDKPVALGQDGSAALLRIISHNTEIIQKYRSNFMQQGIPLFISLEDIRSSGGQTIDFRDFEKRAYYSAALNSIFFGGGKDIRSSFFIILDRTDNDGVKKTYRVGNPDVKRAGVTTYSIKKAIVNPARTSMILVIEMTLLNGDGNGDGSDIRYMVETLHF
jgi:predicted secreted protein